MRIPSERLKAACFIRMKIGSEEETDAEFIDGSLHGLQRRGAYAELTEYTALPEMS